MKISYLRLTVILVEESISCDTTALFTHNLLTVMDGKVVYSDFNVSTLRICM